MPCLRAFSRAISGHNAGGHVGVPAYQRERLSEPTQYFTSTLPGASVAMNKWTLVLVGPGTARVGIAPGGSRLNRSVMAWRTMSSVASCAGSAAGKASKLGAATSRDGEGMEADYERMPIAGRKEVSLASISSGLGRSMYARCSSGMNGGSRVT